MVKPCGYPRVSDRSQVERLSLDTQEQQIREYCARQGWPEPVMFREAGRSAYTDDLAKRPALDRLIVALGRGEFDTLVVFDLDRFARNALLQLTVAREIRRLGCKLVSLHQEVDLDSPNGKMMFGFNAVINENVSDQISMKSRAGLDHIRGDGGYVGGLSFGGKRDAAYRRIVDPAREADLRLLLTLVAEMAYGAAAEALNRAGVRPAKRGTAWRDTSVRSCVLKSRWLLDQPEPWPSLWSAAAARPRLARGNATKTRRSLSGLMRCACGGVIVYSGYNRLKDGSRSYGVQCRWWSKDRPDGFHCGIRKVKAWRYEEAIGRWLLGIPDLSRTVPGDAPDVAGLRASIAARRRMEFVGWKRGGQTEAEYDAASALLDAEEAAIPIRAHDSEQVAAAVRAVQLAWPDADPAERNDFLRTLIARVVIDGVIVRVEPLPGLGELLEVWDYPLEIAA